MIIIDAEKYTFANVHAALEFEWRSQHLAWVRVSQEFHDEMLNAVPPIYTKHGWLVGEAFTHDEDGYSVRLGFTHVQGKNYAILHTKIGFNAAARDLILHLTNGEMAP